MLCFGGHQVELSVYGRDDVIIRCKNTFGLYSQIKPFVERDYRPGNIYPYGVKNKTKMSIKQSLKADTIEIGCLEGKLSEVEEIYKACLSLLKSGETKKNNK